MTQSERRYNLIQTLLSEHPDTHGTIIPADDKEQKRLLRTLFNIRPPRPASAEFLQIQDEYLQEEIRCKGITDASFLTPIEDALYLWQGDITTLKADAIVNAANSQLLGCFIPCHGCIDNAIHTYAGVQLRLCCAEIMHDQGHAEPPGAAKLTPAFNLPARFILHTVGPRVNGKLTAKDRLLLACCYRACLVLAEEHRLSTIAFCCISTGEFHFPDCKAAEIAIHTVKEWKQKTGSRIEVIFNVYKDTDYNIYWDLLQ